MFDNLLFVNMNKQIVVVTKEMCKNNKVKMLILQKKCVQIKSSSRLKKLKLKRQIKGINTTKN